MNDLRFALECIVRSWSDLVDGCPHRLADVFFGGFVTLAALLGAMGEWVAALFPLLFAVLVLGCGRPRRDDR